MQFQTANKISGPGEAIDPFEFVKAMLTDLGPDNRSAVPSAASRLEADFKALREQLPAEAAYHGVTLLIEPAVRFLFELETGGTSLHAKRQFFIGASHHRGLAVAREKSIDLLLEAFGTAGIRVLLLKGAALAHLIYASPELRPTLDIDILIDEADKEAAVTVADEIGYVFDAQHPSIFSGKAHHLPLGTSVHSGFQIFLEIHTDALSSDHRESMKFAELWINARPFKRGEGPDGFAPGHTDMLRHLVRHAFGPARRTRLIHLYDLWRYENAFRDEIDWDDIKRRFNYVTVVLGMVSHAFLDTHIAATMPSAFPASGAGFGFVPLSDTLASKDSLSEKLSSLFNPPSWWLHGFYGVSPEKSLFAVRLYRHPLTLVRWLSGRMVNGLKSIGANRAEHLSIGPVNENNRKQNDRN
jgi:Uncharacterised nucleotidyltransferase